jgi:predicted MFS family arabinose efflux permease
MPRPGSLDAPAPLTSSSPGWTREQKYVLGVLSGAYMFNFADRHLLSVLIEPMKQDLGTTDTQMGLLTGMAFAIFYVLFGIPIASWADRGNRRTILAIGIAFWSIMTAATGASRGFAQVLLARIGVGAGETASGAPVHSLLSDYFPPVQRATALAIYTSGAQLGGVVGITLGGWLEEGFGWRVAFVVMGLPGILLALVVQKTIREPIRGRFDPPSAPQQASFLECASYLLRQRSFPLMSLGFAFCVMASYGAASWHPTLLRRIHDMSGTEVGLWLGLAAGGSAMVGGIVTATLTDRLGRRDPRWYLALPAINTLLAAPLTVIIPFWQDSQQAVLMIPLWAILTGSIAGPIYAMVQGVAPPHMRATAAALNLFVMTLIGMGLGPTLVGAASDYLAPSRGEDSIRFALAFVAPAQILGATLWFLAMRTLREDLERNASQPSTEG